MSTAPSHISDQIIQPIVLTVPQFAAKHPAFSIGGLRWLIFNRDKNGFAPAILKCGRRVLIDESQFFAALYSENGHSTHDMEDSDTVKKKVKAAPSMQQSIRRKAVASKSR